MDLYTRREHGSLPVVIEGAAPNRRYRLRYPGGQEEVFDSTRQLMLALYGRESGMTFERYFRLGRWEKPKSRRGPIQRSVLERFRARKRGVNLMRRWSEIPKLLQASCGQSIHLLGYDFDDVLQEVYKGLIIRNNGECPWDERKSSFGHYVTMVCTCVFSNYHKKEARHRGRERLGVRTMQDKEWTTCDAAEVAVELVDEGSEWQLLQMAETMGDLLAYMDSRPDAYKSDAVLARELLPLVAEGCRRSELADELGIKSAKVGRALSYLRDCARDWMVLQRMH